MDSASRYASLIITIGVTVWDAYAKAHAIPYTVDDWLKGVILAPFGKAIIDRVLDKVIEKVAFKKKP